MKLENVQIEIKSKEHYEAVKKRLEELGKTFNPHFCENIGRENYKVRIYIYSLENIQWNPESSENHPSWEKITLVDLYEVEKKRVIKDRFEVWSVLGSVRIMHICNTHQEAVDFIKKQKLGRYELKYYYEVVEE